MTPQRSRLLARIFASEARLVRLWAPPGYGKSALARSYARRFERHAVCDCAGVAGPIEFASRALHALAAESPMGGEAIAVERLRLHAAQADASAWSRALLGAWKARQEQALFILDHAEALADNAPALALLGDMLAARPPERSILISGRATLPLRIAHYFAPHQTLTLSHHELRMDDDEARGVFEGTDVAPESVDRFVHMAGGWPALLLLLALFARYDARADDLIERLRDVPSASLHEYLANEVISAFTPDMLSTLLATAAIPNASVEDIYAATGLRHATPIVDRLLRLPGFLSSEGGAYQTHPLLLAELRARHAAEINDYLLRAARQHECANDFLRAAELYEVYGDDNAAAAALDRLAEAALEHPSLRLIETLTKLDIAVLCGHPRIWMMLLPHRKHYVETERLYDEAQRLLQSPPADASGLARSLRVRVAMLAQVLGRLAEATTMLAAAGAADGEGSPDERRLALMTEATIAAKQGHFAAADDALDRFDAVHGAGFARFDLERSRIATERARLSGEWHELLKMSEETLFDASRSGITSRIVGAARDVTWAAWFCNDDARVRTARQMLEDCGDLDVRAFARYVAASLERRPFEAPPRLLHTARWQAAMVTDDRDLAQGLFDLAINGIDEVENVFLSVVIRVSAAMLLPTQRRRLLEARTVAAGIESPALAASLELLIDSVEPADHGIFKYLAERIGRSPLKERRDGLFLDVLRGELRRGATRLRISDRGFELLTALALLPAGTTKEELAGAIWPTLDGDAALNALKMCVSRTRAQIGEKEAIASTKRGYTLSERVGVDVRAYEELLRAVRGAEVLTEASRRQADDAVASLSSQRRTSPDWTWFTAHDRRFAELRSELELVLAKDTWRRRDAPPVTHVVRT